MNTLTSPHGPRRSAQQRREHYEIERSLSDRLRRADKAERQHLYAELYDELFRRVPHHPQLLRKLDLERQARLIAEQARLLQNFLTPQTVFLEIGAGDCSLSFEVARHTAHVYAVDVSAEITRSVERPANFTLILSDGTSIPVPEQSITLAYSNQLMEHLHPDDALTQLQNIYRALAPGGAYICLTPNRLTGPHDVSRYYDQTATCFHLKEYTSGELADSFIAAGFRRVDAFLSFRGRLLKVPIGQVRALEWLLALLPHQLRQQLGRRLPVRKFLGKVIAVK